MKQNLNQMLIALTVFLFSIFFPLAIDYFNPQFKGSINHKNIGEWEECNCTVGLVRYQFEMGYKGLQTRYYYYTLCEGEDYKTFSQKEYLSWRN